MGFIADGGRTPSFLRQPARFRQECRVNARRLAHGDWWHIIPSAILTCLLPDIDHPKSFLVSALQMGIETDCPRVRCRGLPPVCLAVFALLATFLSQVPDTWIIPADALQGMVLGYLSHIVADMLTPQAFPYWPCRWRFRLPILAPRKRQSAGRFYVWRCCCGRCGYRSPCRKTTSYAGLHQMITILQMPVQ